MSKLKLTEEQEARLSGIHVFQDPMGKGRTRVRKIQPPIAKPTGEAMQALQRSVKSLVKMLNTVPPHPLEEEDDKPEESSHDDGIWQGVFRTFHPKGYRRAEKNQAGGGWLTKSISAGDRFRKNRGLR